MRRDNCRSCGRRFRVNPLPGFLDCCQDCGAYDPLDRHPNARTAILLAGAIFSVWLLDTTALLIQHLFQ
jgi:hypothetical protein